MTKAQSSVSNWYAVVEHIRDRSESAVEELYRSLRSMRLFFCRQIGPVHADDAYHDVIVDLVGAIRKGAIRKPEALPGYAIAIARGKVSAHVRGAIRVRQSLDVKSVVLSGNPSEGPEELVQRSERQAIAERVLKAMPPPQRETLIRFYLKEDSAEEIQASMGLSSNQFRLIKSRAKLKYAALVRQSLNQSPNPESVDSSA
jgi:RNA polymerase sigma-70 factor, ECF subfamily